MSLARGVSLSLFFLVLVASVGCDHATKHAAGVWLGDAGPRVLLGDTVRFELVENTGAFLSLGAGLPEAVRHALFVGLVPGVLALLCIAFLRSGASSPAELAGLGLIAGGGLANWLDRLLHDGAVRDFVSVGIGPLRTGIFNLADVALVAGVLWLLVLARRAAPAPPPAPGA